MTEPVSYKLVLSTLRDAEAAFAAMAAVLDRWPYVGHLFPSYRRLRREYVEACAAYAAACRLWGEARRAALLARVQETRCDRRDPE